MRAGISYFFPFVAAVLAPFSGWSANAEVRCAADISYKWVKTADESVGGAGAAPSSTSHAATPGATPQALKPTPVPTTVHLLGIERPGGDEAAAKNNLQLEAERQRVRASEACKRDHESFGTCVAMKLSSNSNVLNSLGFSARSELERALSEECRQQQGVCLGVEVSEPRCREVGEPKPTQPPVPEKKADSKKKK